jgi:cobalt-zinc-cadmium efflux system membrane fusion protein
MNHAYIAGALLAALVFASCEPSEDEAAAFEPAAAEAVDGGVRVREDSLRFLTIESVGGESVGTFVRAPGRVAFREGATSEVGAPVDGRVTEVHARVGQRVEAGDPLVTIASPSAAQVRGELARASVLVRAREAELSRQQQMSERGVGIESDRVRAEAELAEARAMLAALSATTASIGRGSAASVTIRAPIAGTVLDRRASVGASVEAGSDPLLVLGEPGAVWVVAHVFERELPLVQPGALASVTLASLGAPVAARVESVGGAVDPQTRRGPIYLSVDDTAAPRLRAGMYASAEIEVGDAGLGVPASAVLVKDGGRTIVYVQRDARSFVARDVHIGTPVGGRAPVLDGLSRGERVVTRGALLLDGQAELLR